MSTNNRQKIQDVINSLTPTSGPVTLHTSYDNKVLKCSYPKFSRVNLLSSESITSKNKHIVDIACNHYSETFDTRTGEFIVNERAIISSIESHMVSWVLNTAALTLPYKKARKSSIYKWLEGKLSYSYDMKDIAISLYLHFYPLHEDRHPDFNKNFSGVIIALHNKYTTDTKG
jgi:hypothetical protein